MSSPLAVTPPARSRDHPIRELASILARGYLRLLTSRDGQAAHVPTCLSDSASENLSYSLDVPGGESDECGRQSSPEKL